MKTFDLIVLTANKYLVAEPGRQLTENIIAEDQLVLDALVAEGLHAKRVAWDDSDFDWSNTNYVLVRTPWDYFERFDAFSKWFKKTAKKTRFINPKSLIDWNIDKHYLKELHAKGIRIPKTFLIDKGEKVDLLLAIRKAKAMGINSDEFVLKPCVAAGSWHTYKFHLSDWEEHNEIFKELIAREPMMLQEFQKNIVSEGEVSMMLIDGKYTHAVLKKAKPGDFRVQDDYGGTVEPYQPNQEEIAFSESVLRACPELPIYARVDLFKDNDGQIALAELEIFEPELWLRFHPEAASLLASAIKEHYFS